MLAVTCLMAVTVQATADEKPPTPAHKPLDEPSDPSTQPSGEQKSPDSKNTRTLDTMQVTAGLQAAPVSNVAAAVSVITRDEFFSRPNALLPDLLRDEAGVYVQQTTPGQGIPIIRGLKGSQNLHLVDGIRLNTAFFRDAPNQYLALVDPFWADQIEVVRGPSSVLYGGDAMGGVVNVITHRPQLAGHDRFSGESYLAWHGAEKLALAHLRMDFSAPTQAASVALSTLSSGQRRIGGGDLVPFTAFDSHAFNGKWLRQLNSGLTIGVDTQHLKQPATPRVDALVAGFGQPHPDAEHYLFSPNQRDFVHLFVEDPVPGAWFDSARYQMAWQKITDQRLVRKWQASGDTRENNQSRMISAKATWHRQLAKNKRLVFGLDSWHDRIGSHKWHRQGNSEHPVASRFPDDSRMQLLAGFAEYRWQQHRWQWNAGVRHSRYRIDLNRPQLAPKAIRLSDWSGHLGGLFSLTDRQRLFANLGRGFRPPNIFDLGQLGPRPGNRFNIANPELQAETLYSLDFGWKHTGSNWHWQSAVFISRYRNKIASVFTGQTTPEGQQVVQSQNVARVRLRGLENELEWYGPAGQRLWATLNYVWGEEDSGGQVEPADRIPPLNGALGFSRPISSRWHGTLQARFAAAQRRLSARDRRDARIDPQGTGGFAVFDAYLTWHPNPNHSLRLGVQNLFDKRYREHGSGLHAPGRGLLLSWHGLF